MLRILPIGAATAAASLLLGAQAIAAGAVGISPTTVQMIGPERTATITVKNIGDAETSIQVRTVDWSQPQGQDVYAPSATLLASPPLVKLAPGASQVVRLVVEQTPPSAEEKPYRLILDEIPSSPATQGASVTATIRALVPVFITASTRSRPSLRWSAARADSGIVLTANNDGPMRERLVDLTVSADGVPLGATPPEGYVLSHASRTWTVTGAPATAKSLKISGEGGFGTVKADVPIGP
jgi:fimbrial chaperone protein